MSSDEKSSGRGSTRPIQGELIPEILFQGSTCWEPLQIQMTSETSLVPKAGVWAHKGHPPDLFWRQAPHKSLPAILPPAVGDPARENGLLSPLPARPSGLSGRLELIVYPLCVLAFSSAKWG